MAKIIIPITIIVIPTWGELKVVDIPKPTNKSAINPNTNATATKDPAFEGSELVLKDSR